MSGALDFLRYTLPEERIAQRPIWQDSSGNRSGASRSDSRLLIASVKSEALSISDSHVRHLADHLEPGDLLVMNDTRVMPWRLFGSLDESDRPVELLLLEKAGEYWRALARPMKRLRSGDRVRIAPKTVMIMGERLGEETLTLKFESSQSESEFFNSPPETFAGVMPIPPYIRRGRGDSLDREAYQTVFAESPGSVAAPTASLHFTPELLEQLRGKGVDIARLTLHVGPSSFLPIREGDIQRHKMSFEYFDVPQETAQKIEATKRGGGRVIAVGTTVVRALESFVQRDRNPETVLYDAERKLHKTRLFITEGFDFEVVDAMVTNFHQPGSTHLLLVAAFLGAENVDAIYRHALANAYRFLSYGDASLLLRK